MNKYFVKFNTRKFNNTFGELAEDVKELCQSDMALNQAYQPAADRLVADGLAKVSSPGPGWGLYIYVDLGKMQSAGLITDWDMK